MHRYFILLFLPTCFAFPDFYHGEIGILRSIRKLTVNKKSLKLVKIVKKIVKVRRIISNLFLSQQIYRDGPHQNSTVPGICSAQ